MDQPHCEADDSAGTLKDVSVLKDADLAQAWSSRDQQAFGEIYRRYVPNLYSYAVTVLHDSDRAADAVHETFLKADASIAGLRNRDRLKPWLLAICRNECLRELRMNHRSAELTQQVQDDVIDAGIDFDAELNRSEATALVADALQGLNEADREVMELALRHDLDSNQVALVLGISSGNARSRLSRSRLVLEDAVGALLLVRARRIDCLAMQSLVAGEEFSPLVRKRVISHAKQCPSCSRARTRAVQAVAIATLPLLALPAVLRDPPIPPAVIPLATTAVTTGTKLAVVASAVVVTGILAVGGISLGGLTERSVANQPAAVASATSPETEAAAPASQTPSVSQTTATTKPRPTKSSAIPSTIPPQRPGPAPVAPSKSTAKPKPSKSTKPTPSQSSSTPQETQSPPPSETQEPPQSTPPPEEEQESEGPPAITPGDTPPGPPEE